MNSNTALYLLDFAKTIAGGYTNKIQAKDNPKDFAHINFFFIPISWSILKDPGFYSEQSYEYDPWAPYRQNIHRLYFNDDYLIMENYTLNNSERVAGASIYPTLLDQIRRDRITFRPGCSMNFKLINTGHYKGSIEEGNKCLTSRSGELTYIMSKVEIANKIWTSEEKGFNLKSNKQVWGSENGPFIFHKYINLDSDINEEWLRGKK
tara:strand:+ start:568 stop:1188 length:621 start_codon:yes stop_codon:yes gene_type:complete